MVYDFFFHIFSYFKKKKVEMLFFVKVSVVEETQTHTYSHTHLVNHSLKQG